MDLANIIPTIVALGKQYPIPSFIVVAVLVVFLWKKPWEFLKFIIILGLVGIGLYSAVQLGDSARVGTEGRHILATETEKQLSRE